MIKLDTDYNVTIVNQTVFVIFFRENVRKPDKAEP